MPNYPLPPDLQVRPQRISTARSVWHYPQDVWGPIWERYGGESVRIAVLDTGVSPHPNLPTPIAEASFIRGQSAVVDRNGHGTHVAGSCLGTDGIGGATKSDLIAVKVLSDQGSGGSDGIAAGTRYAVDQGADIINMSLGGGSAYRPTLEAIDYAWSKGCIVLCAAGNAGYNGANTIGWPAKYANALCVGAYRQDGRIANFSSGGRELDFAMPGQDIVSCSNRGSGFVSMSGTSMATPCASGLFANIIQAMRELGKPTWTAAESVRAFGDAFTIDRGTPGKDVRFGYGIPDTPKIIQALSELATQGI